MKTVTRIAQTAGLILIWLVGAALMAVLMLPGLWDAVREVWATKEKGPQA